MQALEKIRKNRGYQLPRFSTWMIRLLQVLHPLSVNTELFPNIHVKLDLSDDMQRCAFWQGPTYESPTPQILQKWCSTATEAFFDIGANFGLYSFYILSSCPHLPVYSFEPNPVLFAQHVDTKARNHIEHFHPFNIALSDQEMRLSLNILSNKDSGWSTFIAPVNRVPDKQIEATLTTFDHWMNETGLNLPSKPSWVLKMDIEGYEYKALTGMTNALRAHAFKGLSIEINSMLLSQNHTSNFEIHQLMNSFGYQAYDSNLQAVQPVSHEQGNFFFMPI
jgi:FkbM family methyltransferase